MSAEPKAIQPRFAIKLLHNAVASSIGTPAGATPALVDRPYAWPLRLPADVYVPEPASRAVAAAVAEASSAAPSHASSVPPLTRVPAPFEPFCARVLVNTRMTAPEWEQDVRHVELDITGSGLR
jgi:hypothetical protein